MILKYRVLELYVLNHIMLSIQKGRDRMTFIKYWNLLILITIFDV